MQKIRLAAFVFSVIVALGFAANASAEQKRFVQDRFVISFWIAPPADENIDRHYADIAEANFSTAICNGGAETPEMIEKHIAACEKNGLKAIVPAMNLPADKLPQGPAVMGYLFFDEPSAASFPIARKSVDEIRNARPGMLSYINLFPNYANEAQMGTKTYDEYVRKFVEDVDIDVLSMDYYPVMAPGADGREGYCRNLDVMRKYSLAKNIPFWNFFNTMPFGPHFDPTEDQLEWQIFTSIAYGAKGVLYFCYWTPADGGAAGEFPKGGAIVTAEGRKTRHYEQAKRINGVVKKLGPCLMKLASSGVYRIEPTDEPTAKLAGTPIAGLTKGDYLIGTFKHADGRRAVLLNNYSFSYTSWPTVVFDVPIDQVREVCGATGAEIAVIDDSPLMDGLQVSLDASQGRLFLLPAKQSK